MNLDDVEKIPVRGEFVWLSAGVGFAHAFAWPALYPICGTEGLMKPGLGPESDKETAGHCHQCSRKLDELRKPRPPHVHKRGHGMAFCSWKSAFCSDCGAKWTEDVSWLYSSGGQICPTCDPEQGARYGLYRKLKDEMQFENT